MTISLADLPKGHEFERTSLELTKEWIKQYLAAADDDITKVENIQDAPTVAVFALALRSLLGEVKLPQGALHVGLQMNCARSVALDDERFVYAKVASRGDRSGWTLMGIELSITDGTEAPLMWGKATITFPTSPLKVAK